MFEHDWHPCALVIGERSKDAGVTPYTLGGPMMSYTRASKGTASRPYLVSHLSADETYPPIEYFRNDSAYERLLQHKEFPRRKKQRQVRGDTTGAGQLADLEIQAIYDKQPKSTKRRRGDQGQRQRAK